MLISFLLATYNEKETIVPLIERILATLGDRVEIIIVDDCSPDGTADLVDGLGDGRITVIRRTRARGLASAYQRAMFESRGDVLCWMDADGCMPVEMVPAMVERLAECDAVVGSRFVENGADQRDRVRVWASILINGFARRLLGCRTRDIDSGFMVMKRSCLDVPLFTPKSGGEYFIELVASLEKHGYKVEEMGFAFRDRNPGEGQSKSFVNVLQFLWLGCKYGLRTLRAWLMPLSRPRPGALAAPAAPAPAKAPAPASEPATESIYHEGKLLAMLVRRYVPAPGLRFFTPDEFSQQVAVMRHPKGHVILPHVHLPVKREVHFTKEVLRVLSGKVRADFYSDDQKFLESRVLNAGDLLILSEGGHGFTMLEESVMCEVKQGPYAGEGDKIKFSPPAPEPAPGAANADGGKETHGQA